MKTITTKCMVNLGCAVLACLLITACRTSAAPEAAASSTLIDREFAGVLNRYERAWHDYLISGNEGTAGAEGHAYRALVSYIQGSRKEEALRTYILCAPDGAGSDGFRAEVLEVYLKLTPGDHSEFCRNALARRLFEKTYDQCFRVHAARYLAERKDVRSLEFALFLLKSGIQHTVNDGIMIVDQYCNWKGKDHFPSEHWRRPDPWHSMDNSKLASDIAVHLEKQMEIVPRFAPAATAAGSLNQQIEEFNENRIPTMGIAPIRRRVARVEHRPKRRQVVAFDEEGKPFLVLKQRPDGRFRGVLEQAYHQLVGAGADGSHPWGHVLARFRLEKGML